MKYPIEVINVHNSLPYNSRDKYRVFRLSLGAITAAARDKSFRSGLTVRHTGEFVRNGVPVQNDATGKLHVDENYKGQGTRLCYESICDLVGNSLTEQLQNDIAGRKVSRQASSLDLGKESFSPMVVLEAEVILRSKNKKAIADPKANLVFVVKLKTWNGGKSNITAEYSQEHDTLMWSKDRSVDAANIDEVLQFVRNKIASLGTVR